MRKITITICLILAGFLLKAQTTVSGTAKDQKGRPISGVSISIKDSYDGATSDSTGKFSFTTTDKGDQLITASAIGYKPFEQKVTLSGGSQEIQVVLKEEINEMTAVVITAGSFEASDRKRTTVLNSIDVVTTASANGDLTGALKTLPGAQQVGESEGLFVRGGTASETKFFIDGTLVNKFFFSSIPNIATRGRFNPFIFKGTVFSAGGYSALYGQALSSAVILESIDLPDQSSANLGVTVIGGSGGFQQLAKNKKSSWGLNYSYTHLGLAFALIKQNQDFFKTPAYHNIDANYRIKTSNGGMVKYYGYMSANKLGFTEPSIDSPGHFDRFYLQNLNHYHNVSWRENLGNRWKMNLGFSYANNRDEIEGALQDAGGKEVSLPNLEFKKFGLDAKGTFANAKLVMERRLQGLSAVRFGGEYNYSNERPAYTLYNGQKFSNEINEKISSAFAEADVYLTNNIAAKFGSRLEHSAILDKVNIAPRVSLAYKLGDYSQASVAYGIFYQTPESRYLPSTADLSYAKASHYIAQYQMMGNDRTFRAEAFYKNYDNLLKTGFSNGQEMAVNNNGFGDAKGIEFFWRDRRTIKGVDYWISYSYLDTERDFLNYPYALQPNFAAKHTASLVVKKYVQKINTQFNGSYNYASSRPYYFITNNSNGSTIMDQGLAPDYHNVSLSLNYLPSLKKPNNKNFVVYVLSVSNVFGIDQQFGYKYSYNGLRKEAILPPSKTFVFIGAFFSFGVDRSQEIINSNL